MTARSIELELRALVADIEEAASNHFDVLVRDAEPIVGTPPVRAPGHHLQFTGLMVDRQDEELVITGQIGNFGQAEELVPSIRLRMFKANLEVAFERRYSLPEKVVLASGSAIGIVCRVDDFPVDAVDVDLDLAGN